MFVCVDNTNSCASVTRAVASSRVAINTSIRLKPAALLADERDFANPIDVNPFGDGALGQRDRGAGHADARPWQGRALFLVDRAIGPEFQRARRAEGDAGGEPADR